MIVECHAFLQKFLKASIESFSIFFHSRKSLIPHQMVGKITREHIQEAHKFKDDANQD